MNLQPYDWQKRFIKRYRGRGVVKAFAGTGKTYATILLFTCQHDAVRKHFMLFPVFVEFLLAALIQPEVPAGVSDKKSNWKPDAGRC